RGPPRREAVLRPPPTARRGPRRVPPGRLAHRGARLGRGLLRRRQPDRDPHADRTGGYPPPAVCIPLPAGTRGLVTPPGPAQGQSALNFYKISGRLGETERSTFRSHAPGLLAPPPAARRGGRVLGGRRGPRPRRRAPDPRPWCLR